MNNIDINFIFNYFKEFGIVFSSNYFYYAGLKKYGKRQKLINNYLENEYKNFVKSFNQNKEERRIKPQNFKIWVFWWQGLDDMPPIVKLCYKSLKYHAKDFEICLITKNNIKKYINFPEFIWKRFYNNNFSLTHFSDIVRFFLLKNYAGIWIDATVLLSDDICKYEDIFLKNFYTVKVNLKYDEKIFNVSSARWTAFLMSTNILDSFLFNCGLSLFYKYWEKRRVLIDYFLVDYFINILYNNTITVKKNIDDVPVNNIHISGYFNKNVLGLGKIINNVYDDKIMNEICSDTIFHKLSWKTKIDYEKKDSFYNMMLSHYTKR